MFAIALLLCNHANSQKVLLPFGQSTKQPWSASYYFSLDGEEGPSQDWYKVDFDDYLYFNSDEYKNYVDWTTGDNAIDLNNDNKKNHYPDIFRC